MRVSDRSTARNYLKYLNKARSDYAQTSQRITSGNRFTQLSDDISAGSRVLKTRAEMDKAEKQLNNISSIRESMESAEDHLRQINDIITRVNEVVNRAVNGTNTQASRDAYANEIASLKEQVLQIANAKYGDKFLFGGTNAKTAPFEVDKATGQLKYNGIDVDKIQKDIDGYYIEENGQRKDIPMDDDVYLDIGLGIKMAGTAIDPSTGFKISYSGLDILGIGQGADGKSNNIFDTISGIEAALRTGDVDGASELNTKLHKSREKLMENVTDIGARTQYLETMETRLKNTVDGQKERIQNLMGVTPGEEETRLMMNDYALKAVLQMGSRILPISLMDYLR